MLLNADILSFQRFVDGKAVASFSCVDGRQNEDLDEVRIQELAVSQ